MEFSALPHLQNEILEEAVDGEERLCRVNVHLYPDCLLKSVRAYMVLKAVEGQARIIKVEPSLKDLEEENFESSFSLIIISQVDPEEIQNAVENISEVEKVKIFVFNEDVEEVLQEQRRAGGLLMEEDKMTGVTGVTVEEIVQTQERFYKQEKIDTIRVETDKLENMLNNIAELLIAQSRVKSCFSALQERRENRRQRFPTLFRKRIK